MQNAGVRDRVQRLLERHSGDERTLDAYWQWAMNPTPSSAGYALEENCGFIATNLFYRYGDPAIDLVSQLAGECSELRQEATVSELRHVIVAVLEGPAGQALRDGITQRLSEPRPARRLLVAWLANRARWTQRLGRELATGGEHDWSLGLDLEASVRDLQTELVRAIYGSDALQVDLAREAIAVGVANRLFYRNAAGRMEPKMRPGPRVALTSITY